MREKERFEVLLEHMDRKIDVVLEGHQALRGEIERNHEEAKELNRQTNLKLDLHTKTLADKIDQNRKEITRNREGIEKNRKAIEQVDQKVEINREMIAGNRMKIEQVDQKVDTNREKIERLDEKVSTNLDKFEDHERRIVVLESVH